VNYLEVLSFVAKDVALLIDDYRPHGVSGRTADKMNVAAERLLRQAANRAGRGRLNPDSTSKGERPPRSLLVSTGEDIPQVQSGQARAMIVDVEDEIDWDLATRAQRDGDLYSEVAAAFVRWLAPSYEEIQARLPEEVAEVRAGLEIEGHRRTASITAELLIGLRYFLRFAVDSEALTEEEADRVEEVCADGVEMAAGRQARHHEAADPSIQFPALLASAISMGRAYVAGLTGDAPKEHARRWGWTPPRDSIGTMYPRGERIGWVEGDRLYLDPKAAYAVVDRLARENGQPLNVSEDVLWRRMAKAGVLRRTERGHTTIRKNLAGDRRRVLFVSAKWVSGDANGD
jgi:hypothetical protein